MSKNQKKHTGLILILFLASFSLSLAQTVNHSNFFNYKNTTGLLYSQMNEVVQGADGAMHFISMEGATRYDGISFERRTSPYFSEGNSANSMKLTPVGKIMGVFGSEFIFVLDNWAKLKFSTPEDAPGQIKTFEFVSATNLWIATEKGLFYADYFNENDSLEVQFCLQNSIDYFDILFIKSDKRNKLVFGIDRNAGIFQISDNFDFNPLSFPYPEKVKEFSDFAITDNYFFVLYNRNRLAVFDRKSHSLLSKLDFGKGAYYFRIEAITESSVWIASPFSGLVKFSLLDPNGKYDYRRYTILNGLASNYVYNIFKDNHGIFWFATNDGVSKLASERFEKIVLSNVPGVNGFPAGWQNYKGKTYTFSDPFGVGVLSSAGNGLIIESVSEGGSNGIAFYGHYLNLKSNVLWLFSDKGVYYQYPYLSGAKIKKYKEEKHLSDEAIWCVFAIDEDRIILGRDSDIVLARMVGQKLKYLDHIEIPGEGAEVSAFHPFDNKEDMLVGGDHFLIRVGVNQTLKLKADLKHWFENPDFFIYDIERDKNGTWFFGTANDGLIIRDHDEFFQFQNDITVPYHTLYDLFIDSRGNLWGGSYNGITRMHYKGNGKLDSKHFGIYDLIPPMDINFHSIFETTEGLIVYGLSNGIGVYYPQRDTISNIKDDIAISSIRLNNNSASQEILNHLPYQFIDLKIDFYYPVYFHEKQLYYQYKIDPIATEWKTTLAPGQILISNLPSGNYSLNIRVVDPGGVSEIETIQFPLRVQYPFWQSFGFLFFALAFVSLLIYGAWMMRIRRMKTVQCELEQVVTQRTLEISQKNTELEEKNTKLADLQKNKDEFISIVAHDLKNPINAIVNLARMIQSDYENLPSELGEDAKVIESAATHMNNLVKNLLDINRIEANQLVPHMHPIHVLSEIDKILETYRLLSWPKNIELKLEHRLKGEEQIFGDSDSFSQICGNIISNAIKFSKPKSKVLITLHSDDESVYIRIEDWGPGIPENLRERIFDKFYTSAGDEKQNKAGNGLGLTIVKKLVELHNAHIEVSNHKDNIGAVFNLIFVRHKSMENEKTE